MKLAVFSVLTLLLLFSCNSDNMSWVKPGTELIYEVNANNNVYNFVININKLTPEVSFDWKMTDPVNKNGEIIITASARDTSTYLKNYFFGGSVDTLTNMSAVWVSNKIYNELKSKGETYIENMGDANPVKVLNKDPYETTLNGKTVSLPAIYAEAGNGRSYTILDNPMNPIILDMAIQFSITLKEIKTAK